MADSNWIKLNRRIWDNFIWSFEKSKYTLAWIDILLQANYMDKKILFDGKVEVIQRGSFITSMVKLADRWEMNRETVKRLLDLLQSEGMITYTTSNRRTVINVVNYKVFQGSDDTDPATEPTADPTPKPATEPTADPAQHKKVKEGEEGKKGLKVSKETLCSTDVQRIIAAWNELGLSKVLKIVPNTSRHNMIRKRIKDYGVDKVLEAIRKVDQSDFLKGGGDKGWRATFDWFIKPDNFAKVLSGNFDQTITRAAGASGTGRKEMVPKWMQRPSSVSAIGTTPGVINQGPDRQAVEDMERMRRYLDELKTAGNDPQVAARAEALKQSLAEGTKKRKETADGDEKN